MKAMAERTQLISPYPGGKGRSRYLPTVMGVLKSLICDRPYVYDVIVEPLAGSGATIFEHPHGATNAIAADVDVGVRSVWRCWSDPQLQAAVNEEIEFWRVRIESDPCGTFARLKGIYDFPNPHSLIDYAAAYLTLKRLTFGGVLRRNRQKELNVALSQDKLEKYLAGWSYEWPDNGIQKLSFRDGWQGAVEALATSDHEKALVVIDAPYYTPGKKMTEAYSHHGDPGSDAVLRLTTDCLDAVLATGKAERIVVFNYASDVLIEAVEKVLAKHNRTGFFSDLGPLDTMNRGNGERHEYYSECVWEIGGKRMFRDHDAVQQLEIA
jgi:hypothetical protein